MVQSLHLCLQFQGELWQPGPTHEISYELQMDSAECYLANEI
jgi:hypothetical protein